MQEEEAEVQLTKAQELAKAELAAAIASEKASQIEKIAEANMNVWLMMSLLQILSCYVSIAFSKCHFLGSSGV